MSAPRFRPCRGSASAMTAEQPSAPPRGEPERPFGERVRRALARRFPRTRRGYNWLRAKVPHWAGRLRPRADLPTLSCLAAAASILARRRRETRLTVAVDVTAFWEPLTGIGWYLYRLLEHLADRDDVRLRLYGPTVVASPDLEPPRVALPEGPALERVLWETPDDLVLPRGRLIPLLRRLEPLLIALDGNRVLFAPNYFLPRRFTFARGARVATVHDLGLRTVPDTLRAETLRDLESKLGHALFDADRLISVSGAVRDELAAFGYADPARVTVVHHGPGQLARIEPGPLPNGVPARYGLHVGTLEPRKNILGLLAAWRRLRRELAAAPALVLCGRYGWKTGEIRAEVEAAAAEGWLHHLGYVAEEELAALYRGAAVVVFPSLYEGFGLPAVEAQWAGAPLVCSDIPVLREVAEDGALYAPADRPAELAARIAEVLTDGELAARLVERGRARVARLSWEASAERTLGVFRRAAGLGKADPAPGATAP